MARWLFVPLLLALAAFTRADDRPLRESIDEAVQQAWTREGLTPSQPASDAEFLRRVSLDLIGVIPTAAEAKEYLDDPDDTKHARLIDRLLSDPRYARHQAEVWDLMLFGRHPPGHQTDKRDGFQRWLGEQFAKRRPYNQWVGDILQAEGNSVEHGAPMYLVQYNRAPEDAAVAIAEQFLGVQLQCARCHDHPYESWTQLDFYGMAAFLARIQVVEVGKQDGLTKFAIGEKSTGDVLFSGPAIDQKPGQKGEPVGPKYLNGEALSEPELPADWDEPRNFASGEMPKSPFFSRKDRLAEWVASPDNPWLARAVVNRVWAQFLGRGIVHPVDDLSEFNTPSHPELLKLLERELMAHDFDLTWLIRELVHSRAYRLSSAGSVEEARPQWFQQARWRPLSAEELIDSWRVATGYDGAQKLAGREPKGRFDGVTSGYMMSFFGEPTDGVGNFQGGLHEHLYLNNGEVTRLITMEPGGLCHTLLNRDDPWESRVEDLFLATLSRRPTQEETARVVSYITEADRPEERLREAVWALLTGSEFRFNH
jgi:hypothetical protein